MLEPRVQVITRIPPSVADELKTVVKAREISISQWVEGAIIRQLEAEKAAE